MGSGQNSRKATLKRKLRVGAKLCHAIPSEKPTIQPTPPTSRMDNVSIRKAVYRESRIRASLCESLTAQAWRKSFWRSVYQGTTCILLQTRALDAWQDCVKETQSGAPPSELPKIVPLESPNTPKTSFDVCQELVELSLRLVAGTDKCSLPRSQESLRDIHELCHKQATRLSNLLNTCTALFEAHAYLHEAMQSDIDQAQAFVKALLQKFAEADRVMYNSEILEIAQRELQHVLGEAKLDGERVTVDRLMNIMQKRASAAATHVEPFGKDADRTPSMESTVSTMVPPSPCPMTDDDLVSARDFESHEVEVEEQIVDLATSDETAITTDAQCDDVGSALTAVPCSTVESILDASDDITLSDMCPRAALAWEESSVQVPNGELIPTVPANAKPSVQYQQSHRFVTDRWCCERSGASTKQGASPLQDEYQPCKDDDLDHATIGKASNDLNVCDAINESVNEFDNAPIQLPPNSKPRTTYTQSPKLSKWRPDSPQSPGGWPERRSLRRAGLQPDSPSLGGWSSRHPTCKQKHAELPPVSRLGTKLSETEMLWLEQMRTAAHGRALS